MRARKSNRDEVRKNSTTVLMTKDEREHLEAVSAEMGVSMSTFIRIALNYYIKNECGE